MASIEQEWLGANNWTGCKLVVSSVPNTTGNYSDVTATLYGRRTDGGTSYNQTASNFWIDINGTKTSRTSGCTVSGTGWTQVHTQTTRVYHNDDGSKTISIGAGGGITGSTFQMNSRTINFTLDKIARKSSIAASDGTLGAEQTLTVTKQDDSFTHTITYVCGSASGTICAESINTSVPWTPSLDLAAQNITGVKVTVVLTIETFIDGDSIGTNTKTITCSIPESVAPSVSLVVTDDEDYFSTFDAYVQSKSKFNVAVSASGSYGSTIQSYQTTADGKTYTEAEFSTDVIVNSGEMEISVTVTDSRGRTATATQTVEVLAYKMPQITAFGVKRSDADGNSSSSGEYLAVSFDAAITALNSKNDAVYRLSYKKTTEDEYTSVDLYNGVYEVIGGLGVFEAATFSSYDIILEAVDAFGSATRTGIGSSVRKLFSWLANGLGWAFGKVAEMENTLDIAWEIVMNGKRIKNLGAPVEDDDAARKIDIDNLTAEDVGARPDTWMPTPVEVGVAPAMESEEHPGCYYRIVGGVEEWLNPPLVVGVEYRTTERFQGKPVYVKVVDCGDAPAGSSGKTVAHNIANIERVISCSGATSQGLPLPYTSAAGGHIYISAHSAAILLYATYTSSQASGISATIKYTKK